MKGKNPRKMFQAVMAATVVGGVIAVGAPVQAQAEAPLFSDVKDTPAHHFYEAVMKYTARGMMSGYPDGTFRPNESITRQDAAKLLSSVLQLDMKDVRNPGFKDVSQSSPYYGYIAALVGAGIITGFEDNTFRPEGSLTRAQMAKILSIGFNLKDDPTMRLPFSDINQNQWHLEFVRTLYANEITTGTSPSTFSPNTPVTRGQMVSFVLRSEKFDTPKGDNEIAEKRLKAFAQVDIKDETFGYFLGGPIELTGGDADLSIEYFPAFERTGLSKVFPYENGVSLKEPGYYEVIDREGNLYTAYALLEEGKQSKQFNVDSSNGSVTITIGGGEESGDGLTYQADEKRSNIQSAALRTTDGVTFTLSYSGTVKEGEQATFKAMLSDGVAGRKEVGEIAFIKTATSWKMKIVHFTK